MLNIAIVDDEIKEQELLKSFFKKIENEKGFNITLQTFSSGEEFLFEFEYDKFDIVLMDIDFGDGKINGIEASKRMRQIDRDVILIFITNLAQFAIDGYKVNAFDFIVKPFSYFDFSLKIESIITHNLSNREEKVILKSEGRQVIVPIKDIFYIEVINHTLIYYTEKGNYSTSGSLSEVTKELNKYHFSLCNSCYLINLRYVESINGYAVMVHGKELIISRPRKKLFLNDLNGFLGL